MPVAQKKPSNGAQLFRPASSAAPAIKTPSPKVRAYLRSFQLAAVVALADGTVTAVRDLGRVVGTPVEAWWTTPAGAIAIVDQCRALMSADVVAVAVELRTPITAHDVVLARASASVQRMTDLLEQARANGSLSGFNRAYAQARAQARAAGRYMMPYPLALDRLKKQLYKQAAGATIDGSIIAAALGIKSNKGQG